MVDRIRRRRPGVRRGAARRRDDPDRFFGLVSQDFSRKNSEIKNLLLPRKSGREERGKIAGCEPQAAAIYSTGVAISLDRCASGTLNSAMAISIAVASSGASTVPMRSPLWRTRMMRQRRSLGSDLVGLRGTSRL